ncbi:MULTISPECIES: MFS transporter [Streptomyces]|nr:MULTISPECIES: MFS transporter [Streptomyces]MCM3264946.1 MFS transporter [Streptomyces thermoviolaceus]RSR95536.1 MFS transporter [Streptomyces sp. WAC00469]WTD48741.1 MFS transporter [Streptomyces thermoviolaceus]GGV69425.1 MFS transporter [Streptomyces thermoviolaceus subsp. apingens]GHB05380.1 MFS transporter [Streptomyces thermoviolaceus subsp. thermoviolaceus]
MSTGSGDNSAPAPTTHDSQTSTDSPRNSSMFSSLKIRNYRLFFLGQVVSNTGTWMQRIAQDWLVLSLTGSSAAVGITTALQFLPMLLFGLYGGVLVDRLPKRPTLLCTQSVMALTGLALAGLTLSGHVQVWHVYLAAFVMGLATVLDNPARQTFVSEMVGPQQLQNAVSLNSANFQSARLIGPAVAGVMITSVGTGWAFLVNGLSFAAPITGLLLMRARELHVVERAPRGKGQLREGLRYVAGHPNLLWPIVLVGFIGTFGFNFPVWLSAYADDVFHAGAGAYSLFNTVMAVGSLAGALLAARRGTARLRLLIAAAAAFGALEIVAAVAPEYWLFALLMAPIGVFGLTVNVTANTTVQMGTAPAMRGRVMSLFMMVFVGGTPLGAPLVGWMTDTWGARAGFAVGGAISLVAAVTIGLLLARAGGLRLSVGWNHGHPQVRFVPKEGREELAPAA